MPRRSPQTEPPPQQVPRTIAVGQPRAEAMAVARRAGYEPHDAGTLSTSSVTDGVYLDLPGDDALLVGRDPETATVKWVDRQEHGQGPKLYRVDHPVTTFDLPPAPATQP